MDCNHLSIITYVCYLKEKNKKTREGNYGEGNFFLYEEAIHLFHNKLYITARESFPFHIARVCILGSM